MSAWQNDGWNGRVLVIDVALIAGFAVTASVADRAIFWVLLGMMIMRLAADYGYWRRGRP